MANNTDSGEGTLGCLGLLFLLFIFLSFVHYGFGVIAFIIFALLIIGANYKSSSSNKNTATSNNTIPANAPDDLDNILRELGNGEIKDPVTQEIFRPSEKVYLCYIHRLAYHEDSWTEMGRKCMVCGNATHTKIHTLSPSLEVRRMDVIHKIEFRDIE